MADDKKVKYPKLPRSVWFALREKMKQRVPDKISPSYLASAFQMEPLSAQTNIIPALQKFGLIDESYKPLERVWDWRDDSKYSEVCAHIIDEVYPTELRDLYHTPDAPRDGVKNWFARSAKVGDAAADKFAATYLTLLETDLTKSTPPSPKPKSASSGAKVKAAKVPATERAKPVVNTQEQRNPSALGNEGHGSGTSTGTVLAPKLHIDIQIHISPESTPDQIDKIFESMAKHLKDFRA